MKYSFIVNPVAGHGRSARVIPLVQQELAARGIPFEVLISSHPGESEALAGRSQGAIVVAVGGDGTINEVVNGIPSGRTLGIIPTGSGNDLIKSLSLPKKPGEAFEALLRGKTSEIDLGRVRCAQENNSQNPAVITERLFSNGVGVGFDASVAIRKGEIPYLRGTPVYVLAVLQTLLHYTAPTFSLCTNGSPSTSHKLLLAAIGNGRCAGGGFYLTPNADPGDGQLDVTLVDDVPVWKILALMPSVMKGKHLGNPAVRSLRTSHLVLQSGTPFNVHADGEIVGRNVLRVEISLHTARLSVICG
jgi:diacylglycerol kinase (ATP)